jgi:ssDNA-binding Zn-finger/Zn-ribbon topoisomerase 1
MKLDKKCPECGTQGCYEGFKEVECIYWACKHYSERQYKWFNEQERKKYEEEEVQLDGPDEDYAD